MGATLPAAAAAACLPFGLSDAPGAVVRGDGWVQSRHAVAVACCTLLCIWDEVPLRSGLFDTTVGYGDGLGANFAGNSFCGVVLCGGREGHDVGEFTIASFVFFGAGCTAAFVKSCGGRGVSRGS